MPKDPGVPTLLPDPAGAERYYRNLPPPEHVTPATLEHARRKLAQMPLDVIPDLCALPAGSCLAFAHNPLFVGRESDLRKLAHLLKAEQDPAVGQVVAATGPGGIGKTQLVREFVHRYGQYFAGGVHWINLADAQSVPAEVACCSRLERSHFDLEAQIHLTLSAWQSELPRLLVFDSCEDEGLLDQWRPKSGGSRVLITSRRPDLNTAFALTSVPLGVLERHESIELLQTLASRLDQDQASAIADALEDLPLALHLAGCFLRCSVAEVSPEIYLRQLQNQSSVLHQSLKRRGEKQSPPQRDLLVGCTFALSYDELNPQDNIDCIALPLLGRAACLAPGVRIPRALLLKTLKNADSEIDPLEIKDAMSRILDLGLIEADKEGDLVLHRLLSAHVRNSPCTDTEARQNVETTLLDEAGRINNSGLSAGLLPWQAHLRFVTEQAMAREDEAGAQLCNAIGYHLHSIGDFQNACLYYEKALEIRQKVLGGEHPNTARSLSSLGFLLRAMGELQAARPYYEKSLKIRKKVLGEEHPETAQSLNNLGFLLQAMGELQAARPYYEKAAKIRKKVLARGIRIQH